MNGVKRWHNEYCWLSRSEDLVKLAKLDFTKNIVLKLYPAMPFHSFNYVMSIARMFSNQTDPQTLEDYQ